MENEFEQEDDEQDTGEQHKNSAYKHLAPYQFKPGQSGNPSGRPKGPSMKEWAKNYLAHEARRKQAVRVIEYILVDDNT